MAQDFSLRYPLIDRPRNFGSPDPNDRPGSPPRYTEARLAQLAMELLGEIDEDTVNWSPNYDGSRENRRAARTISQPPRRTAPVGSRWVMATTFRRQISASSSTQAAFVPRHPDRDQRYSDEDRLGPDLPTGAQILGAAASTSLLPRPRLIKLRAVAEIEETPRGDTASWSRSCRTKTVRRGDTGRKIASSVERPAQFEGHFADGGTPRPATPPCS